MVKIRRHNVSVVKMYNFIHIHILHIKDPTFCQ